MSWYEAGPGRALEVHLEVEGDVDPDAVKVSVQDRNAVVDEVVKFGQTGEGAAIALLIDTVGYDRGQQDALRAAGKAFVENMGGGDQAAVLGVGETLHGLERDPVFTSDPPLLYRQLEELPFDQDGTTALWRSCIQALEAMDAPGLPNRKALILLSDGFDRTKTTHQDCLAAAQDRQVPVFTAWYRPSKHQDVEGKELLRSVSTESGGNFSEQPSDDQLPQMMQAVQTRLRDQWVVRASTVDHDQGELPVRIQLRSDMAVVQRLDFPGACCDGEPALEEAEDEGGLNPRRLGIAGAAVLLLIGGLWLLFGGKKKAPKAAPRTPQPPPPSAPKTRQTVPEQPAPNLPAAPSPKTAIRGHGWRLQISEGDMAGQSFDIADTGLRVGANTDNDAVIADGGISGNHCRLIGTSAGVELVDLESTNGTWVDDQRIDARLLGEGDSFRAGSHTFVVRRGR